MRIHSLRQQRHFRNVSCVLGSVDGSVPIPPHTGINKDVKQSLFGLSFRRVRSYTSIIVYIASIK